MQSPPAFDPWTVDFENWFTNSKRAVIPNEKKHEWEFKGAIVDEEIETRHKQSDAVQYKFKLLVIILVSHLFRSIQNRNIDIPDDNLKQKKISNIINSSLLWITFK